MKRRIIRQFGSSLVFYRPYKCAEAQYVYTSSVDPSPALPVEQEKADEELVPSDMPDVVTMKEMETANVYTAAMISNI